MSKKAIDHGAAFAEMLVPLIKSIEALENDKDRVRWWGGFMGGICGAAAASIGPEAMGALASAIEPMMKKVHDDHTH